MRYNKLDLNLLVALDALLTERSITRAGERMNLTPSAVSNALARLRTHFDDELLVQVGRKMEPTPRAEGLHDAVRDVLVRIESTITTQPAFDPTTSDRSFKILLSDYSQLVLGPHLVALAAAARCTARFEFLPQVANPLRILERGEADLLIMPRYLLSPDHPLDVLYTETFVCVVWREGAWAEGALTMQRYAAAGHVVMQPAGTTADSFESQFIKQRGIERRIAMTCYCFSALPALVCGTDLIATLHRRLALTLAGAWPVVMKEPPLDFDTMEQAVQWHRYRTNDPGIVWLRGLLAKAVVRLDASLSNSQPGR